MRLHRLPNTKDSLVLRTDFSDDSAYMSLCSVIREPVGEFRAYVECVSDVAYEGLSVEQLVSLAAQGFSKRFLFVVDRPALTSPEHPILVIDLDREPGRTFRVIARELWGVENNLSIDNMNFEEFADSVDADGVFRGFS